MGIHSFVCEIIDGNKNISIGICDIKCFDNTYFMGDEPDSYSMDFDAHIMMMSRLDMVNDLVKMILLNV